jgi:hypothetical protein
MKIKDLLIIYPSLQKVEKATHLKVKSVYGAAKAVKQIRSILENYQTYRKSLYKSMGEIVEVQDPKNPEQKIPHPNGYMKIKPEFRNEFETKVEEYENQEEEIYEFKLYLSDLMTFPKNADEKLKFSVEDISNLMQWIIDDVNNDNGEVKEPAPTC